MALEFPRSFPTGFLPPVVAEQARAEGELRRQLDRLGGEDPDGPLDLDALDALNAAARSYVVTVATTVGHQACAAARAGQLRPDQISEVVDKFIRRIAEHTCNDFDPPLFGSPDPHLGWSGQTDWLDDVRQAIKDSPEWRDHLAKVADLAAAGPADLGDDRELAGSEATRANDNEGTGATESHLGALREPLPLSTPSERREFVDAYIQEVLDKTGHKIWRKDIWQAVGYKNAMEFEKWQRCAKHSSSGTHAKFVRLLTETKPHLNEG